MPEWNVGHTKLTLDAGAGSLTVSGDLEFGIEREFHDACMGLVEAEAKRLFVDLGEVRFISSSCLGALFLLHERAKERGAMVRVRVHRQIEHVCEMMGVSELMDVEVAG